MCFLTFTHRLSMMHCHSSSRPTLSFAQSHLPSGGIEWGNSHLLHVFSLSRLPVLNLLLLSHLIFPLSIDTLSTTKQHGITPYSYDVATMHSQVEHSTPPRHSSANNPHTVLYRTACRQEALLLVTLACSVRISTAQLGGRSGCVSIRAASFEQWCPSGKLRPHTHHACASPSPRWHDHRASSV